MRSEFTLPEVWGEGHQPFRFTWRCWRFENLKSRDTSSNERRIRLRPQTSDHTVLGQLGESGEHDQTHSCLAPLTFLLYLQSCHVELHLHLKCICCSLITLENLLKLISSNLFAACQTPAQGPDIKEVKGGKTRFCEGHPTHPGPDCSLRE